MSYADQAALAADPEFQARLGACIQKEARSKSDPLASEVLTGSSFALQKFLPWVTTEPGFDVPDQSTITDGQLLAAVQTVWPQVLATSYPQA